MRMLWLSSLLVLALAPAAWCVEWQLWSPRAEIAPKGSMAAGELVLEGAGNAAVFGGWERTWGEVRPHQWYRLEAKYRATGLGYEPLEVPVRLDWMSAEAKRVSQPDYGWKVTTEGEWSRVTLDAPAPAAAAAVKVQLLLQNAPNAVVRWKDVKFAAVDAPQPRKVTIATVRLKPRGADPVTRFIDLVNAAVPEKTDVILLPEGMEGVGTGKKYAETAETLPGPTTERLSEVARKRRAWIVAGIYEREGAVIYNTAVLIDREGRIAGKYRKVYLPREEFEGGLTPGSEFPVFETDFGKIGMMICWDVQYADPARGLALRGAELILMPIAGGNETLAAARAIENHVYLASSGYDFPSQVLDPTGRAVARSESDGTVATATIDLNQRYLDPWLGDMRARYFRELRGDVKPDPAGRK